MILQTRNWLEEDPSHVFHVIVDELHMYRGTSGTEVAYLVRNLLHRLGLHPDSDQVRFLATSASLGTGEEAKTFLSDFFGADAESFAPLEGEIVQHDGSPPNLNAHAEAFAAVRADIGRPEALELVENGRSRRSHTPPKC